MRLDDLLQIIELIILVVIMCFLISGSNHVELKNITPDTIVVKSDTFKLAVDSAYYTIEKINYVD